MESNILRNKQETSCLIVIGITIKHEEIITDIQGAVDIGPNGLIMTHHGTVLKSINVKAGV